MERVFAAARLRAMLSREWEPRDLVAFPFPAERRLRHAA